MDTLCTGSDQLHHCNDEHAAGASAAAAAAALPGSSFGAVTQAFAQRVAELQQLVCFRVEDSVKHVFLRDMQGLDASVRALEQLFEDLRRRTAAEAAALPKARALLAAAHAQAARLQAIGGSLPAHLPSAPAGAAAGGAAAAAGVGGGAAASGGPRGASTAGGQAAAAAAAGASGKAADAAGGRAASSRPGQGERRRRGDAGAAGAAAAAAGPAAGGGGGGVGAAPPPGAAAPRWYVTAAELAGVPGYMRGRLTLERVNAAIDELAGHAEACARGMAAVARNQLGRLPADERARLHAAYHAIAVKDGARGRFWFLDSDVRAGTAVRMDRTGKSLLMLLRHLGRVHELRAALGEGPGGGQATAYVLLQAPAAAGGGGGGWRA